MTSFVFTVGPTGRTYTSLNAAWAALPATVPAGDDYTITMAAGLYGAGLDCTSSAKTITGTVLVKPETGAAWYEVMLAGALPLRYDNTKGVAIEFSPFGKSTITLQSNVSIQGLQIYGGGQYGAVGAVGSGLGTKVSRCLIRADATNPKCVGVQVAWQGTICNSLFVTTATVPCIEINDTNSYVVNFIGNTVIKPDGGGGNWNQGQYGTGLRVKDCAFFGFSGTTTTLIDTANTSYNATDLASFPGTSNVLNLVAANQFVDATAATLNLTVKAASGLVAGITNATIPTDAIGTTRASTPTIGALEYVSSGATITLTGANASQSATSSTGVVSVTAPVAGTVNLAGASASQSATSGTGVVVVSGASGTLTLLGLKNNTTTPATHANLAGITTYVYNASTGALVVTKTGQTTNASGNMTVNDALIIAGTTYRVIIVLAASAGEGLAKVVAT